MTASRDASRDRVAEGASRNASQDRVAEGARGVRMDRSALATLAYNA